MPSIHISLLVMLMHMSEVRTFACIRIHDCLLGNDVAEVIGIQPLLLLNLLNFIAARFNLIGELLNPSRQLSVELLIGSTRVCRRCPDFLCNTKTIRFREDTHTHTHTPRSIYIYIRSINVPTTHVFSSSS